MFQFQGYIGSFHIQSSWSPSGRCAGEWCSSSEHQWKWLSHCLTVDHRSKWCLQLYRGNTASVLSVNKTWVDKINIKLSQSMEGMGVRSSVVYTTVCTSIINWNLLWTIKHTTVTACLQTAMNETENAGRVSALVRQTLGKYSAGPCEFCHSKCTLNAQGSWENRAIDPCTYNCVLQGLMYIL